MHNNSNNGKEGRHPFLDRAWSTPGYLMAVGGADRLDPDSHIIRLFLQMAERTEANTTQRDIVVVGAATRHPELLTGEYVRIMTRLGVPRDRVHVPLIRNREEAQKPDVARRLESAAGIYITGGDQYALTQTLDGTPAEKAIRAAYNRGAVVAGTSAGATAMGRPMVVAGGGSGELRLGMVQMSNGLAWAGENIIIDTHFGARGRFPRLAAAVAEHPLSLGVGIDENTCLLIDPTGHCIVAGIGVVYFVDASGVLVNSAQSHARSGHPISVGPLNVVVLSAGGEYELRERRISLARGETSKV